MIPTRSLGKTDLNVSLLGFGTWQIGGSYTLGGKPAGLPNYSEKTALDLLAKAKEQGINFFETSNQYGKSEELLGKFFHDSRDCAIIASKCGITDEGQINISPQFIVASVETSLRKLKTEYIDIYQITISNLEEHDVWKAIKTLDTLKREGKVRYIGISLKCPGDAMTIIKNDLVDVLEVEYNLFEVGFNKQVIPFAQKKGIGIIIKSPLNKGVLTGKYSPDATFDSNDFRSQYLNRETLTRRNKWIESFCQEFNVKREEMKEVALGFVFSNPGISVVALGMRNVAQLEENLSVLRRPFFEPGQIQKMEQFSIANYHILGGKGWNQIRSTQKKSIR